MSMAMHTGAMPIGYWPEPGQSRTKIIVWEIDDPSKQGDGRYWWLRADVQLLQGKMTDFPDLTGRPRGESLASLRRRADAGQVDLTRPRFPHDPAPKPAWLPLDPWMDADPERTFFIIAHQRAPTKEEQEERKAEGFPWPGEAEAYRQQWLAADALGDKVRAVQARQRFDAMLAELGFRKARDLSPWNPERATEVRPGVFVQDERPSRPAV
jgi:hypothetical protein